MKPLRFTARIGRIGVLRSVIVPPKIVAALGGAARIPVIATYCGEPTRSTLVPAGGAKRRLVLQMDVVRLAPRDIGDTIAITLAPDTGPRRPPLPPDLARALQFRPTAAAALDREPSSTWRIMLESLENSRTPETRQRRLERLIERLAENSSARATKV